MTLVDDNLFPKLIVRESANDGSDFTNPAADYRVLFVGEDGLFHLKDSSGTVTTPAQGGLVDPMTTRGDLIIRDASNVTARKAIGAADTFLGSDGTDPAWGAVTDAKLSTSDITTNNASTSKHGFLKKLSNVATEYMDGTGAWSTPAGGGGSAVPVAPELVKKYATNATNGTSAGLTLTAHASGHRMIVCVSSYNRDVNSVTCTNVTFTEVLATNFSTGAYLSIYVGVIAGGSSGTTLTVACTGSNWIVTDVYIVSDTLTPTAGTSATLTNTDASTQAGIPIGPITPAIGSFYIVAAAQNDGTTGFSSMTVNSADPLAVKITPPANSALASAIGRTCAASVYGYTAGGSSGGDFAAGIVVVT